MCFALFTRPKRAAAVSSIPVSKRKAAPERYAFDSQLGFKPPASLQHATLLPVTPVIQTKLKIGQPNDKYEEEADRVADMVMRMPEPDFIDQEGLAGPSVGQRIQRLCSECEEELHLQPTDEDEESVILQLKGNTGNTGHTTSEVTSDVEFRIQSLRGGGQPLPKSERVFFEPRFGFDFSAVRIHTDGRAASLAQSLNARAFTVSNDIFFGYGSFHPDAASGKQLLAHELTHTIQQQSLAAASRSSEKLRYSTLVQRACEKAAVRVVPFCIKATGDITDIPVSSEEHFRFKQSCNDFLPGEEDRLKERARRFRPHEFLRVHGFASEEGAPDPDFNDKISCVRAHKASQGIERVFEEEGVEKRRFLGHFNYGAVPGFRTDWRAAVIEPIKFPLCGPDTTQWMIDQFSAGKRNKEVLEIKDNLSKATQELADLGLSADRLAEGGVLLKLIEAWQKAGEPVATREALQQIKAAEPGLAEIDKAFDMAWWHNIRRLRRNQRRLEVAANKWKSLVQSGAKYDFKAPKRALGDPRTEDCPDSCCPGSCCSCTLTLCDKCFLRDVPGNIFYAHVGRFAGWTELALQLGSQFAQLTSRKKDWDPPEDTAMIKLGFHLPDVPASRGLCNALNGVRRFRQSCIACDEPINIGTV